MRLGLTEARFWSLTPAEYFALVDQVRSEERRTDERLARLLVWIGNRTGGDEGRPFKVADFLRTGDEEPQSVEAMKAILMAGFRVREAS